jgi:hypothetical protein
LIILFVNTFSLSFKINSRLRSLSFRWQFICASFESKFEFGKECQNNVKYVNCKIKILLKCIYKVPSNHVRFTILNTVVWSLPAIQSLLQKRYDTSVYVLYSYLELNGYYFGGTYVIANELCCTELYIGGNINVIQMY